MNFLNFAMTATAQLHNLPNPITKTMEPTTPDLIQAFIDTEAKITALQSQLNGFKQAQEERSLKIRSEISRLASSFAVELDGNLYLTEVFDGDLLISPLPKIN